MPAHDFSSHDPDFSSDQEAECARLIDAVRTINSQVVRLSGSREALAAAADQVEALAEQLRDVTRTRALETFRFEFDRDAPNRVMPFNPATGEFNPVAPAIKMFLEDKILVAEAKFSDCYETAPDTVQGGMVAALYDQLLAFSAMTEGTTGPTLSLSVKYLKPTPLNELVRFESEVVAVEGNKITVAGRCSFQGQLVSEAEALVLGAYDLPLVGGGTPK